ncbi:hypothetical protein Tco_0250695 [Tanacetum coccineum]
MIASTSFAHYQSRWLVEILKNKSISEMEISKVIEEQDPTWMTPIIEFVSKGTLPLEQKEARRIHRTAQRFELRNGVLYRRSFLQPWLRCVGPIQADYVLREIHAGSCSMPLGPTIYSSQGAYGLVTTSPTMHRGASCDTIRKCMIDMYIDQIPRNHNGVKPSPHHGYSTKGVSTSLGPFPVAAGGLKFLIVAYRLRYYLDRG